LRTRLTGTHDWNPLVFQNAIAGAMMLALAFVVLGPNERKHPPGQIAPREPVQTNLYNAASFKVGAHVLHPRARFDIEARVLSRERYWAGSRADLMPIDIAVGWGPMSDTALIEKLSISQGQRFYFWSYSGKAPASHDVITRSSANMHLIPADDDVKATLFAARPGDVLILTGDLVDVDGAGGWKTQTSLVRDDTGNGACETVYVRTAMIR
jgi:hypothetical protein